MACPIVGFLNILLVSQNMSFSANCTCREEVAVVLMTPAEALMVFPVKTTAFGSEKLG